MHVYIHETAFQRVSEGSKIPLYHLIFPSVLLSIIPFMYFTYLLTFTVVP